MNDRAVSSRPGPPPSGWGFGQTGHPAPVSAAARVVVAGGALAQRRPRRPRRGLVLVVAAALLAGCTWGGGGSTATSMTRPRPPSAAARRAGRIVFSTTDDVYVVDGDGTGLQRLTKGSAAEFDPSWSPDGRQITYRVESGPAATDIYVMNADGSGQRRIASGISPAWSPDGAMIAYGDDQGSISVMRPDGSASRRVPGTWQGEYPSWSPDGARLAFMDSVFLPSRRGGTSAADYEVYVINLDGSELQRLTHTPARTAGRPGRRMAAGSCSPPSGTAARSPILRTAFVGAALSATLSTTPST